MVTQDILNTNLNYDLIEEGDLFYSTCDDREFAETHAGNIGGYVRNYGVRIMRYDPSDRRNVTWEKYDGYSVWADPDNPPFDRVSASIRDYGLAVDRLASEMFGPRHSGLIFED